MTDKLFDSFVRDKLEQHSSPVPDGLWEKIINEKERKPKIFWWTQPGFYAAAAGVILMLSGYFLFKHISKNNTNISNNSTLSVPQQTNTISKAPLSLQDKIQGNNNGISKNLSNTSTNNSSATFKIENNSTAKADAAKSTISSNVKRAIISGNRKSNFHAVERSSQQNIIQQLNGQFSTNKTINNGLQEESNTEMQESKGFAKGSVMLSLRSFDINNALIPPINLRRILGINDCPSVNGKQRNDWYVELYASPDYSMKTITGNGASATYLQKKDSTENPAVGFTAGVRITKTIGDHLFLKAGVQYAQINEKFAQRLENERKTTTVIVTRTISRPQGDTTITDTSSVTQVGYKVLRNINHYKSIEIPVLVGYEFGKEEDDWKVAVNGGIIVNASSWYNGITLDTSLNVVTIDSKGSNGVFQKNTNLSLYGSVQLIRKISDYIDLFAEPYFRYSMYNTSSNFGFSQKFNTIGVSLGTRIKLNRRQHY